MPNKKARNAANQAAVDRLYELKAKQSANSKLIHTISRAINSVVACSTVIENRKQAVELKSVGPFLAKTICPHEAPTAARRVVSRGSSAGSTNDDDISPPAKRKRAVRPLPKVSSSIANADPKAPSQSAKQIAYDKAVQEATSLKLSSGPWKVILLVDGREHNSEHVQAKLSMSGIPTEVRTLPIGDMAWLARCGNTEIMLGTIVERKEVNDLKSSLFGTRYAEQRLRLQHCGLPQVLLLIEGDISSVPKCPADTIGTCMMETRVQLGFQVIQTKHLDDTVRFLKTVHRRILQRSFPSAFGDDAPTSLPSFASPNARRQRRKKAKVSLVDIVFDSPPVAPLGKERFVTYTELKAKVERDREAGTRTVGAIHAAMLKQIPTLSLKKVQAIQQAYPTPSALYGTYVGLLEEDGKTLVQDFSTNTETERTCRVGPKSAAEVYLTYTKVISNEEKQEQDTIGATSTGLSQDSAISIAMEENVARMPPASDPSSPVRRQQGFSSSPLWSTESDSKPAARWDSPPRKPAASSSYKSSPTSPADEMQLALQRRRQHYQDSQQQTKRPAAPVAKKPPPTDNECVDLTQGYESDEEDNMGFSQSSFQGGGAGFMSSQASSDVGPSPPVVRANNAPPPAAPSSGASVPASSQGSISVDDDEEEPLYVRVQRLHEARQAIESRKRQRGGEAASMNDTKASAKSKKPSIQQEVIEIE